MRDSNLWMALIVATALTFSLAGCGEKGAPPESPGKALTKTPAPPQPAKSPEPGEPAATEDPGKAPEPASPETTEKPFDKDLSNTPLNELIDLLPASKPERNAAEKEIIRRATRDPAVAPELFKYMGDGRFLVRWMIANIYGQLRDPQTLQQMLISVTFDNESHVRWRTIWAVNMTISRKNDLQAQASQGLLDLMKALKAEQAELTATEASLRAELPPQDLGAELARVQDEQKTLDAKRTRLLAEHDRPEHDQPKIIAAQVEVLKKQAALVAPAANGAGASVDKDKLTALRGEQADLVKQEATLLEEYYRRASVALSQFGGAESVAVLHQWLDPSVSHSIRWETVFCLGKIHDEHTTDLLIPLLKDKDVDVAKQTALSLGGIGDPKAIPALTEALLDGPDEVRWRAASGLGSIGGQEAVDALQKGLAAEQAKPEPSEQVINAIQSAIKRGGRK